MRKNWPNEFTEGWFKNIMEMIQKIFFNNYLLMLSIVAWAVAQVLKTLINFAMTREFSAERLYGSGGMPSSHSALVTALFVGTAKKFGASNPLFAVTLVLAAVVMHDAMGVRLETGKQAKLLNMILDDLKEDGQPLGTEEKLKELIGHTPLQVLSGALLGVLIAVLIPVF